MDNYLRALPGPEIGGADQAVIDADTGGRSGHQPDPAPVSAHSGDLARPSGERARPPAVIGENHVPAYRPVPLRMTPKRPVRSAAAHDMYVAGGGWMVSFPAGGRAVLRACGAAW